MFVAIVRDQHDISHAFRVSYLEDGWLVEVLLPDLSASRAPTLNFDPHGPKIDAEWKHDLAAPGAPAIILSVSLDKETMRGRSAKLVAVKGPGAKKFSYEELKAAIVLGSPEAIALRDIAVKLASKIGNRDAMDALFAVADEQMAPAHAVLTELGRLANASATAVLMGKGFPMTANGRGMAPFLGALGNEEAAANLRVLAACAHKTVSPYSQPELASFAVTVEQRRRMQDSDRRRRSSPEFATLTKKLADGSMDTASPSEFNELLKMAQVCNTVPRGMVASTVRRMQENRLGDAALYRILTNKAYGGGELARLREVALAYVFANPEAVVSLPLPVAQPTKKNKPQPPAHIGAIEYSEGWAGWSTANQGVFYFAKTEQKVKDIIAAKAVLSAIGIKGVKFRDEIHGDQAAIESVWTALERKEKELAEIRRLTAEKDAVELAEIRKLDADVVAEAMRHGLAAPRVIMERKDGDWEAFGLGTFQDNSLLRTNTFQAQTRLEAWKAASASLIDLVKQPYMRQRRADTLSKQAAASPPRRASRFGMLAVTRGTASMPDAPLPEEPQAEPPAPVFPTR